MREQLQEQRIMLASMMHTKCLVDASASAPARICSTTYRANTELRGMMPRVQNYRAKCANLSVDQWLKPRQATAPHLLNKSLRNLGNNLRNRTHGQRAGLQRDGAQGCTNLWWRKWRRCGATSKAIFATEVRVASSKGLTQAPNSSLAGGMGWE